MCKHALLIVFDYNKRRRGGDLPTPLLAMDVDLRLSYKLAINKFKIKPRDVTIITDLRSKPGVLNPWDPLSANPKLNPRVVRLSYPEATRVCAEVFRFVENTVRGIGPGVDNMCVTNDIFIYISCHGGRIPKRDGADGDPLDSALILTSPSGRRRFYLRDEDIFSLLFGQIRVHKGSITIPISTREIVKKDGIVYQSFKQSSIKFESPIGVNERLRLVRTKSLRSSKVVKDRGVPFMANMLMTIDACHSGTMADFFYIYNPKKKRMDLAERQPPCSLLPFPMCVCLAASQNNQEAPSTNKGSIFTRYLYDLFMSNRRSLDISRLHRLMYRNLPRMLVRCKPTITSTVNDIHQDIPFNSQEEEKSPDN